MPAVQIVAVTTTEIGPNGPIKRLYAVGVETPELALELITRRLKAGEVANWLDARHLSLSPGEIRQI